jgi:hypothetical protein
LFFVFFFWLCIFFVVLLFVSSSPSALLCHSFFFFDFHILFVSFLLHFLMFVCIWFNLSLYLLILATIWSLFVFSSSVSISHSLLLWKRLMVHYHIQCGLCSVCRLYMNLFNFIVYYHNSKIFFIKIYGNNVY